MNEQSKTPDSDFKRYTTRLFWLGLLVAGICLILSLYLLSRLSWLA